MQTSALDTRPNGFVRYVNEINFAPYIVGQCGIAACVEGDPGSAKTDSFRALSTAAERLFLSYELSRTQPEDLGGFPVVSRLTHAGVPYEYMKMVPDERLLRADLQLSLLLLDEMTNVGPSKQAAALNLVQRGIRTAWMFMACNPLETAADAHPFTCPMINRIWYGAWEKDDEAFDWGLTHRLTFPTPEVPIVPANYMDYSDHWGELVRQYFQYNPQDRDGCPKAEAERHKPFPSRRSWRNTVACLAAAEACGVSVDVRDKIIRGFVGEKVGQSFVTYLNNLQLPSPQSILDAADNFVLPDRFDVAMAILGSVVNYLRRLESHRDPQLKLCLEQSGVLQGKLRESSSELYAAFTAALRAITVPSSGLRESASK